MNQEVARQRVGIAFEAVNAWSEEVEGIGDDAPEEEIQRLGQDIIDILGSLYRDAFEAGQNAETVRVDKDDLALFLREYRLHSTEPLFHTWQRLSRAAND